MDHADRHVSAHAGGGASAFPSGAASAGRRKLPIWGFVTVEAVYLAVVLGLGKALTSGLHAAYASPTSVNELWRAITVPVLVSVVFVYAVVAVLGWWRPVFTDDRPVQRWVRVLPVIMVITAFAGMNYTGLARNGGAFTALLARVPASVRELRPPMRCCEQPDRSIVISPSATITLAWMRTGSVVTVSSS